MNVKKIMSLSIALAVGLISNQAIAKDKIVIWEDSLKSDSIKEIAKSFELMHDCEVEIKEVNSSKQIRDYQELSFTDTRPDVLVIPSAKVGSAIERKVIEPITFMNTDKNLYQEDSIKAFSFDNKVYAAPRSIDALIVFYNKDIIPYPYETIAEYKTYKDNLVSKKSYGLIGKFDDFFYAYGFLKAKGGYLFGKNQNGSLNLTDVGLNNDGAIAGLKELSSYINGYIPQDVLELDGLEKIDNYFIEGKAAAVVASPESLAKYAKANINFGIGALPKLDNGKSISPFYSVKGYAITKSSKHKNLANEFIQYLNEPQNAIARYLRSGELPPIHNVLNEPFIAYDDLANTIVQEVANLETLPYIPELDRLVPSMNNALTSSFKNQEDPSVKVNSAISTFSMNN